MVAVVVLEGWVAGVLEVVLILPSVLLAQMVREVVAVVAVFKVVQTTHLERAVRAS